MDHVHSDYCDSGMFSADTSCILVNNDKDILIFAKNANAIYISYAS